MNWDSAAVRPPEQDVRDVNCGESPQRVRGYQPIEHYGIIGDLYTVGLVGLDGSIDFMCFPHFDSPSIFAGMLDQDKGGRFQLAPLLRNMRHKQLYLPDTNVLLTRFLSDHGMAEVSDFMAIEDVESLPAHTLVRRAKCVRGEVQFLMYFQPAFNYGRSSHQVEKHDGCVIFSSTGDDGTVLRLRHEQPVTIHNGAAVASFSLRSGETAAFVMELVEQRDEDSPSYAQHFVGEAFKHTVNYWRDWIGRSKYTGRWREMVNRSGLTLKLLTSKKHGSVVAAPTFGLPETLGGVRNWDYRYTWIRDASFSLYALIRLGYTEEAGAFMRWIENRCAELNPDGSLQIMYGIDGRHELTEFELDHFEGYRQSSPVRVGNAAYQQIQLDIYGELMDAVYLYDKYGEQIHYDLWTNLVRLLDWVCSNWRSRDAGIWEIRGGAQEFLYSRLMCWVALDRGIRLSQKRSLPAPLELWYRQRDAIYQSVFEEFWHPRLQAFVQHKGAKVMDAANLLMPLVRFISPTDPRWLSTLRRIEHELVDDSLVYRYTVGEAADDGLTGDEGTFCMCSFWYAEAISRTGNVEKARFYFEKMLGYANHLGLYAEELGPAGEHLGNFPQAFTHLGLVSTAFDLNRRLDSSGISG
ncbi:MAG: glycoside hydrolase family 15 protein [Verrucomicrobiota bacterium]